MLSGRGPAWWAKHLLSVTVLVGVAWLVWAQARRHWASVSKFHIALSWPELGAACLLCLAAYLLETRAWQRALNATVGRHEMSFGDSIATANTSNLLKYLPGRVWSYGAQMMWLGKRGVSKGRVVYVNLACLLCSLLVSTLLGGAYLIVYIGPPGWGFLSWPALAFGLATGLMVGPRVLAASIDVFRRLSGRDIELTQTPPRVMLELGGIYVVSWGLIGAAGYYAALGVGLLVTPRDVTGITASMSVAWAIGYLSALTPGGLGVREGLMSVMLGKVSSPESALVLPIVSRLLYLSIEVLLGVIGLAIGFRRGLFTKTDAEGGARESSSS